MTALEKKLTKLVYKKQTAKRERQRQRAKEPNARETINIKLTPDWSNILLM
jgi:hypothetical protein